MMTIKRTINKSDLRNFCIKFNLCTMCDNDTYNDFIMNDDILNNIDIDYNFALLARLINNNSENNTTENIMYLLANNCCRYVVEYK